MIRPRSVQPWLLFGVALLLRAGWVGYGWVQRGPELCYDDESLHWQLATNLIRDGTLVSDDGRYAARMPFYPLFLAALAGPGEVGILLARLAQAILGACGVVVLAGWARAAAGARAAWLTGVLAALDPFAIFFASLLLSEVVFTFLLIVFLRAAWLLAQPAGATWRAASVLALSGAALVLTRPSVALLVPLVWCLVAWIRALDRVALSRLALAPVVLAAALIPWGLRNQAVLGSPAWLSTNGGVTLYDALGPQADGSSNQEFLRTMPGLAALDEVALDQHLRRLALESAGADLPRVLRLAGTKLARTWTPSPNVAEYRTGATAWIGGAYSVGVYGLAVASLVWCLARSRDPRVRRLQLLAWSAALYFALVHAVYIGSVRYRLPVMPLLVAAGATLLAPRSIPGAAQSAAAAPEAT